MNPDLQIRIVMHHILVWVLSLWSFRSFAFYMIDIKENKAAQHKQCSRRSSAKRLSEWENVHLATQVILRVWALRTLLLRHLPLRPRRPLLEKTRRPLVKRHFGPSKKTFRALEKDIQAPRKRHLGPSKKTLWPLVKDISAPRKRHLGPSKNTLRSLEKDIQAPRNRHFGPYYCGPCHFGCTICFILCSQYLFF